MELGFPEIVDIIENIKQKQVGNGLIDSEVAALQCAWDGITYSEFVENQERFTLKYVSCYKDPSRLKKTASISTCGSKLFKILTEYFASDKLSRMNFRRKIKELVDNSIQSEIGVSGQENRNDDEIDLLKGGIKADGLIIANQDIRSVINFVRSIKPIISIYGQPGIGKTTLAHYISQLFSNKYEYLSIYTDLRYIDSFTQWAFEVLAQARIEIDTEEEILMSLFELFDSRNVLIIIDSILHLDRKLQGFIEAFCLRNLSSKSRIILCSQADIPLNISSSLIEKYQALGLQETHDIYQYFNRLGLKNSDYWKQMSEFYSGNFREIRYAGQFIIDFFAGDVGSYWEDGTRVISPETTQQYESIEFTQLDISIFSMFAGEGEHVISQSIRRALVKDSSTSELWARIHHLCSLGYLHQKRDPKSNILSFSIAPLLESFLVQEKIIDSKS